MQTNHASYIKGLSIAVIVIGALGILSAIASFAIASIGSAFISDYGANAAGYAHGHGATHGLDYEYGLSDQQSADLAALVIGAVGGVLSIWVFICHIVVLVAGIIGLRGANQPEKLGQIFGWSIGGAVASFLSGGLISTVLLIIMAVFANKDKKLLLQQPYQPEAYQQPPYQGMQ